MLSMFELTTGENLKNTMHPAKENKNYGIQPVLNHSSQNALYFVVFICLAFFVMVRTFIGIFMKEVRDDHMRLR